MTFSAGRHESASFIQDMDALEGQLQCRSRSSASNQRLTTPTSSQGAFAVPTTVREHRSGVTASPEGRAKQRRTSLLVFHAVPPPTASQRHRKKKENRERRRHQRRRGRRSACSETVEDASSTSSDVRFKSKTRMCRPRRAQVHHIHSARSVSVHCYHLILPSQSLCSAPPSCCCLHKTVSSIARPL